MNSYGAAKITRAVAEYVTGLYDLEDHRGNEEYASWEEDYQLYLQDMEKLTGDIDEGVDDE